MKTKVFILIVAALMVFNFTNADNSNSAEPQKQAQLAKKVTKAIEMPQFAIDNSIEGDVYVNFSVRSDGSINIIKVNSGQQELKEYVIDELKKMYITPEDGVVDKEFNLKFSFRLL